jgi:hypothetical protein
MDTSVKRRTIRWWRADVRPDPNRVLGFKGGPFIQADHVLFICYDPFSRKNCLSNCALVAGAFCNCSSGAAENLPDICPALIGSGKEALINLIDTQKLIKNGQRDAAVMFRCSIENEVVLTFLNS